MTTLADARRRTFGRGSALNVFGTGWMWLACWTARLAKCGFARRSRMPLPNDAESSVNGFAARFGVAGGLGCVASTLGTEAGVGCADIASMAPLPMQPPELHPPMSQPPLMHSPHPQLELIINGVHIPLQPRDPHAEQPLGLRIMLKTSLIPQSIPALADRSF